MTASSTKLGDVIRLKRGYDLPQQIRKQGDVPVVSSSGITGYHSESKVSGPGVVIGRYGTLGQVFYLSQDYWPLNTSLYVEDFKGNSPRFVAYALETLKFLRQGSAAAVPGVNRNTLHEYPVEFPGLEKQERIVTILERYDDLIENNRRRIKLLEESARLLYREWFVHLRFPGHEHVRIVDGVPEAWTSWGLEELGNLCFGHPFKSSMFSDDAADGEPVVRIRDVPRGDTYTYTGEEAPSTKKIHDGDVLIGMDGDFHMTYWSAGEAWLNQRVTAVRPSEDVSGYFLRMALERPIAYYNSTLTGTTVRHLGARHLREIKIALPPTELRREAMKYFRIIGQQIQTLRKMNTRLTRARDLLLPRLMNGEIAV